jgi:hypothetical protein
LYNSQFQAPVSGTIAANNATIDISENDGAISGIQITGTWVGTLTVEGSNDNSNFSVLPIINRTSHALITSISSNGIYESDTNGFQYLRIKSTSWTSGTATIVTDGSKVGSSHVHSILRATDGTAIGSVGDALKISGSITAAGGLVSTNNASSSLLTANSTFTGTFEEITNYSCIMISVVTDRSGTLFLDYSNDGSTSFSPESLAITPPTPGTSLRFSHQYMSEAKYFRVRYVNGATNQGSFNLQSILKSSSGTAEVGEIQETVTAETDALTTKGVIYGLSSAGGGTYVAVKVNPSGSLQTSAGTLGQATSANSAPVVIASDQSTIPANDGISSGGIYGALTMTTAGTTYEAKVGASSLSSRKLLTILPTSADIYWGYSNAVTTSTGTKIPKDITMSLDINKQSTVTIFLVSASNSVNVRITEAP